MLSGMREVHAIISALNDIFPGVYVHDRIGRKQYKDFIPAKIFLFTGLP